ncbi:MAG: tRNA (adenosine(37)-N6)-threonylcarbamoyltransferase complex dimerization subunit type 1 TsaB [Rhodocyclaceae bacterium]
MNILALETSCETASVALATAGDVLQITLQGHTNHSEHLLEQIGELLSRAGLTVSELDAIAFGAGPGAFTGVRLACGVAQGLAMGAGLGVIPVNSLAALCLQAHGPQVFVATDARMGECYGNAFRLRNGRPEAFEPPCCLPPEQLSLPDADGPWEGIGSAFKAYAGRLDHLLPGMATVNADAVPRACDVLALARLQLREGGALAPELASPLYVRNKVALTIEERRARGGKA